MQHTVLAMQAVGMQSQIHFVNSNAHTLLFALLLSAHFTGYAWVNLDITGAQCND